MGHQQLAVDQENIGLDAHEAMIERIQQRPLVQIVVVRVGLSQRADRRTVGAARLGSGKSAQCRQNHPHH